MRPLYLLWQCCLYVLPEYKKLTKTEMSKVKGYVVSYVALVGLRTDN